MKGVPEKWVERAVNIESRCEKNPGAFAESVVRQAPGGND